MESWSASQVKARYERRARRRVARRGRERRRPQGARTCITATAGGGGRMAHAAYGGPPRLTTRRRVDACGRGFVGPCKSCAPGLCAALVGAAPKVPHTLDARGRVAWAWACRRGGVPHARTPHATRTRVQPCASQRGALVLYTRAAVASQRGAARVRPWRRRPPRLALFKSAASPQVSRLSPSLSLFEAAACRGPLRPRRPARRRGPTRRRAGVRRTGSAAPGVPNRGL
jgi:hypothetical protein